VGAFAYQLVSPLQYAVELQYHSKRLGCAEDEQCNRRPSLALYQHIDR
jgi:hypothetical protein